MKLANYTREMVRSLITSFNQFRKDPTPKNTWEFIRPACLNYLSVKKLVNGIALIGMEEVNLEILQWVDEHFSLQMELDNLPHQQLWKSLQTVIALAIIADLFGPYNGFHRKNREIERTALRILRKQVFILKKHRHTFALIALRRELWRLTVLSRRDTYHNLGYILTILKPSADEGEHFETV